MNMFARFDKIPAMTLQDIKKTKCYGRTDAQTDNVKTVYPPQTKFAGSINMNYIHTYGQTQTSGTFLVRTVSHGIGRNRKCLYYINEQR